MEEELEEQEVDIWIKNFSLLHPLSNIALQSISIASLDLMAFFKEIIYLEEKDGAYVINLDNTNSKRPHKVSLFINKNTAVYFDSLGIEYILQEVLNKIKDKSISLNIFRIQDNESIMCGFYCIAFIEYMLAVKTLLDYTNLFSRNDYKKNDKIIYYFKDKYSRRSKSPVQI